MSEVAEELKKKDKKYSVMVSNIIELYTSCIQLSLYIFTKKKINLWHGMIVYDSPLCMQAA